MSYRPEHIDRLDPNAVALRIHSAKDLLLQWKEVQRKLQERGYVVIEAWDSTRDTLRELIPFFGRMQRHEFGAADGIVDIQHGSAEQNSRFGYSETDFMPHTDGAPLEAPPAYVLLQTVRAAAKGGETILVDSTPILRSLSRLEPALFQACTNAKAMRSAWPTLDSKPHGLWEALDKGWRVRLNSRHTIDEKLVSAVRNVIDTRLHAPDAQIRFALLENQVLVVDNFRMLHGRTRIEVDEKARLRARHHRRAWTWHEGSSELSVPECYRPLQSMAPAETALLLNPGVKLT